MKLFQLHDVIKFDRPGIGLDLETTGLDSRTSSIVELALEIMSPGKEPKEYRTLVNPLMPIPPEATAIHGITNDLIKNAPTFKQLSQNLLTGLTGCDFFGYNVRFDLKQLAEEFTRAGHEWSYADARIIDGYRLWQLVEGHTLTRATERWLNGESFHGGQEAHNALWDVKASTRVIAAQLHACQQLPRDLNQLHELQWPGWFDPEGKLRWVDDHIVFTFGVHQGKPLQRVPRKYLEWIIKADFSKQVKAVCRDALKGKFPIPVGKPTVF